MQFSGFSDVLLFMWIGVFSIWFGWTSIKIYRFYTQTRRQTAISKPQYHDIIKAIAKGAIFASLILIIPLSLANGLILSGNGIQLRAVFGLWLTCLTPLVLFALFILWSYVENLRNFGYPWTDEEDVPLLEPPQPPPSYASKSFEQLSAELDESLKQRTDKS